MHSLIPPNKPILFHSTGVEKKMTLGNGNQLETVLNAFSIFLWKSVAEKCVLGPGEKNVC